MSDDYEFWEAQRDTFMRLVEMGRRKVNFHVWTCPGCQVLQRAPIFAHQHPKCPCGTPMPTGGQMVEGYEHRTYVPPRIPTAEHCRISEEGNAVARRLVESALS